MDVIRHDAPSPQLIPVSVEMEQSVLNSLCIRGISKNALSFARVKKFIDAIREQRIHPLPILARQLSVCFFLPKKLFSFLAQPRSNRRWNCISESKSH
jgi:hypothetical protein